MLNTTPETLGDEKLPSAASFRINLFKVRSATACLSGRVPLSDSVLIGKDRVVDVVSLDDALCHLEERNTRWARIVELKLLGGLEAREISELLHLSQRTVERDLKMATLFLLRELDEADA